MAIDRRLSVTSLRIKRGTIKEGSSAESVGGLRLGEVAQLMVKGNAQMLEVPISKGSSHRVAYFQIEP
ncbi:MAG: hypothetical protein KGQ89_06490, partial [Verrucomicrobia bacterium]|nr:hypothetical protein [Verrucomicrobiota bacterium]